MPVAFEINFRPADRARAGLLTYEVIGCYDVNTDKRFEDDAGLEAPVTDEQAGAAGSSGTSAPLEPLENAVVRLEEQLSEANNRLLRLAADFDNFRKRVARERIDLSDKAQAAFVIRLLEVLDDLDRLAASDPGGPADVLRKGVDLVDRKLRKELEAAGLERIDPAGEKFDPAVAEAVSIVPPPSPAQNHEVSVTFQVGYRFKGSLVRPARVQVYSSEDNA
jgi:molecular chaperone GrpE